MYSVLVNVPAYHEILLPSAIIVVSRIVFINTDATTLDGGVVTLGRRLSCN